MANSRMPWIKLYTDILDHSRLGCLPESVRWRFIQLLAFAGELDAEGYLAHDDKPLTMEEIAWRFRIPVKQLTNDMQRLRSIGLLVMEGDTWLITNFARLQGRKQKEKRKQWLERQRRHRQSKAGSEEQTEPELVDGQPTTGTDVTGDSSPGDKHITHLSRVTRTNVTGDSPPAGKRISSLSRVTSTNVTGDTRVTDNVNAAPVTPLEEEEESEVESDKEGEGEDSPTSLFCRSFGFDNLHGTMLKSLQSLEKQYGAELLCEVIQWADDNDIPKQRALAAIKTAIKNWQVKSTKPKPSRESIAREKRRSALDQARREFSNGTS